MGSSFKAKFVLSVGVTDIYIWKKAALSPTQPAFVLSLRLLPQADVYPSHTFIFRLVCVGELERGL